jgi:hypothetical protein
LIPLIHHDALEQTQCIIDSHSKPTKLFIAAQLFLILHEFLDFNTRLECMRVNWEWRNAVRNPKCWITFFGTTDYGEERQLCKRTEDLCLPKSSRFVQQMLSCWTNVKRARLRFLLNHSDDKFLTWLLQEDFKVPLEYLQLEYLIDYNQQYPSDCCKHFIQQTMSIVAPNLRVLQLNHFAWRYFFKVPDYLNIYFPTLEEMTVVSPFEHCFLNAPNIKKLSLQSTFHTQIRTPYPLPFLNLECIQFNNKTLRLSDLIDIIWPHTLHIIQLTAGYLLFALQDLNKPRC